MDTKMNIHKILVVHHKNDLSLEVDLNTLECYFDLNMIDPYTYERTFHIHKLEYTNGKEVEQKVKSELEYLVYDSDDLYWLNDTKDILDDIVEIYID